MKTSAALSALILVTACQAAPSDAASLPPPPDEIAAIVPPTGPLLGVAQGGSSATFLDRAGVVQIDGAMHATLLVVYRPVLETPYGAAHIGAERVAYDCARRTMTPLGAQAFDQSGQRVMWLPPGPPESLEPGLSHDFVAQVLCDGADPPTPRPSKASPAPWRWPRPSWRLAGHDDSLGQQCPIQLELRTFLSDGRPVNRDQFLRALRTYCRRNDLEAPRFDAGHGKGGHGRIWVGARFTTARTGEISRPLHKAMLAQLGLPTDAF